MVVYRDDASSDDDPDLLLAEDDESKQIQQRRLRQLQEQHCPSGGEVEEIEIEKELVYRAARENAAFVLFFQHSFARCRLLDEHLKILATRLSYRFYRIEAAKAPFLVAKFFIKVLPTVLVFKDGKVVDCLVGFDELGNRDDFSTDQLERRLLRLIAV